jgi:hypothetical protein
MEALAKGVNLQVGSVRPKLEPAPKPPTDPEARKKFVPWPYDKIHVDMEVRGSYWNVARLLYQLTEFPKILAVEAVQVQSAPPAPGAAASGKSPDLTVSLKLTGFIFPNDGAAVRSAAGTLGNPGAGLPRFGDAVVGGARSAAQSLAPQVPPIAGTVGAHARQPGRVIEPAGAGNAAPAKGI